LREPEQKSFICPEAKINGNEEPKCLVPRPGIATCCRYDNAFKNVRSQAAFSIQRLTASSFRTDAWAEVTGLMIKFEGQRGALDNMVFHL